MGLTIVGRCDMLEAMELVKRALAEISPESELYEVEIDSGILQDQLIDRMEIKQSVLRSLRLLGCDASRIYMSTVQLYNCDLSNTTFEDGKLSNVLFKDCKLVGSSFNDCKLEGVVFENCLMGLSQFSNIQGKGLRFMSCQLEQAYFDGAKMPKTLAANCNLTKADFSGAFIIKSDLRGSRLDDMRVAVNQLSQVVVTPEQALYLARLMGLQIEF